MKMILQNREKAYEEGKKAGANEDLAKEEIWEFLQEKNAIVKFLCETYK